MVGGAISAGEHTYSTYLMSCHGCRWLPAGLASLGPEAIGCGNITLLRQTGVNTGGCRRENVCVRREVGVHVCVRREVDVHVCERRVVGVHVCERREVGVHVCGQREVVYMCVCWES